MAIYKDGVRYVVYYNGVRYVDSLTTIKPKPKCAIPSLTLLSLSDAKTVYVNGSLYTSGATASAYQTISAVYSYSIQDGSTLSCWLTTGWTICTTTKQVSYYSSKGFTVVKTSISWNGFTNTLENDFFTTQDNYDNSETYHLSTGLNGPIHEQVVGI